MKRIIALCGLCIGAAPITQAQFVVDALDRGNYTDAGFHDPSSVNYSVGNQNSPDQLLRSFYVFSVPASDEPFTSATLSLFSPANSYRSSDSTETLGFFAVATSISTLRTGGSGLTSIFSDLGDGTSYGTKTVSAADNSVPPDRHYVNIALNGDFLNYVNAHRGEQIAIGSALLSLDGNSSTQERMFAGTDPGALQNTQLVLSTVPEPGEYAAIAGLGLTAFAIWRHRARFARQ